MSCDMFLTPWRSRLVGTETALLSCPIEWIPENFFTHRLAVDTRISNLHLVLSPVVLNNFWGGTKVSMMTDAARHGPWNVVEWCSWNMFTGKYTCLVQIIFHRNYPLSFSHFFKSVFISLWLLWTRPDNSSRAKSDFQVYIIQDWLLITVVLRTRIVN